MFIQCWKFIVEGQDENCQVDQVDVGVDLVLFNIMCQQEGGDYRKNYFCYVEEGVGKQQLGIVLMFFIQLCNQEGVN